MALDFSNAKITEVTVFLDSKTKTGDGKHVLWATVQIYYPLPGLQPEISIHVPIKWEPGSTAETRKAEALQNAHFLLDQACLTGPEKEEERAVADRTNILRARV